MPTVGSPIIPYSRRVRPKGQGASPGLKRAVSRRVIDPEHQRKLKASGLEVETVEAAKIYSEHDTRQLRVLLRGIPAVAPALILPGFDRHGHRNGYAVAWMDPPFVFPDGRPAKYLMPRGLGNRAYFPPLLVVAEAANTPGTPLMITEGIFKALAASQAGVPCIGLMGAWNWVVGGSDPRQLISDLEEIDWRGRTVVIVFDFDTERKPGVNHAAAELARVLTEHGADVRVLQLPPGPRRPNGKRAKQAVDDFIVRHGDVAFRKWLREQLATPPVRPLQKWRAEMEQARIDSLEEPGIYLDRSPTGAGKTYADGAALNALGRERRSLTLVPTHFNCGEVSAALKERGIACVPFPKLSQTTCARFTEAHDVMRHGLVFQKILCPECEYAYTCDYRGQYREALSSPHAVATLKRGEIQMGALTKNREYVTVHESPLVTLRPQIQAAKGFLPVAQLAEQAGLKSRAHRGELAFYHRMQEIAKEFHRRLRGAIKTEVIELPAAISKLPKDADRVLWELMDNLGIHPPGDALQLVMMATAGNLDLLVVMVDTRDVAGQIELRRSIVGRWRTKLPADAVVWLNDATGSRVELEVAAGRSVRDMTPAGRLEGHWPVVQIPRDVTQRTTPDSAEKVLRGILYDLPEHKKVGVVTHKRLVEPLRTRFGPQLAMISHFRGGQSRGSNEWLDACDALIVLGTPRVPPEAIRRHLVRLGNLRAVGMTTQQAAWGLDWWSDLTESGSRVTVRTLHYGDHDWHDAHRSLVLSELKQAIGRARQILPGRGMPCYLVTTEDMGESLADRPFAALSDPQVRVLRSLRDERGYRVVRKTGFIAERCGLSRQRVHKLLCELDAAGRVRRVGKAAGWLIPDRKP